MQGKTSTRKNPSPPLPPPQKKNNKSCLLTEERLLPIRNFDRVRVKST